MAETGLAENYEIPVHRIKKLGIEVYNLHAINSLLNFFFFFFLPLPQFLRAQTDSPVFFPSPSTRSHSKWDALSPKRNPFLPSDKDIDDRADFSDENDGNEDDDMQRFGLGSRPSLLANRFLTTGMASSAVPVHASTLECHPDTATRRLHKFNPLGDGDSLAFAQKLPNIRYQHMSPTILEVYLTSIVAPHQTVDLVTVAQAFHWFDRPTFYQHVKLFLRRPNGVLAVWCYTEPQVDDLVDTVFWRFYTESEPFWDPDRKMAQDENRTFEFPFEPVEGTEHTGPFEFEAKRKMDFNEYLTYIRSGSPYQTATQKGVELLREQVVEDFKQARGGEDKKSSVKVVKFSVFLRIGEVGQLGMSKSMVP